MKKGFLSVGHLPTLFASFFYFDMSFMVWVLLGPLGVQIANDLDLSPAQKGFMVAVPVLSGALLRIVAGIMVDRLRPKLTGIILQVIVIASLLTASPARPSRSPCRWRRSGIRWITRARRSASPARAIPARSSRPCLRRRS